MDYFEISVRYAYRESLKILQPGDYILALILFIEILHISGIKYKRRRYLSILVPYIYLVLMFAVFGRSELEHPAFELAPFWSYAKIISGKRILLLENLLNVVMFVPLGFLLGGLGLKLRNILLSGLCMSYFIECSQLILHRGLFELFDDPFHNVLGALVGYLLFVGIMRFRKSFAK